MNRLAIWLLAAAGVLALLASRAGSAATAGSSEASAGLADKILEFLGLKDSEAVSAADTANASGFQIDKIGGDTILPDNANSIDALRQVFTDTLSQGGNVEYTSPEFAMKVQAPVTVEPIPLPFVPTPDYTQTNIGGILVPLNAPFIGFDNGRRFIFWDFATDKLIYVPADYFGETGSPALGFALNGQYTLPAAFTVQSGAARNTLVYHPAEDPNGLKLALLQYGNGGWGSQLQTVILT